MLLLLQACGSASEPSATSVIDTPVATAHAVVASRDLVAGTVLSAGDMQLVAVPAYLPDPIRLPDAALRHTVREPIFAGEALRRERLVPPDGDRVGFPVLAPAGTTATPLALTAAAAFGLQPGCQIEVVRAEAASRRPQRAHPRWVPVLGTNGTEVVIGAKSAVTGRVTVVMQPPAPPPRRDNPTTPAFEGPPRGDGPTMTVAKHPLLPGTLIRAADLAEVPGAPHNGLRFKHIWAQIPHLPVYPGEVVREERLIYGGTGLCWRIPDGLRGVTVPVVPGTASVDWVESYVAIDVAGNGLGDLYVVDVAPDRNFITVAALPETAWAIAVAAAVVGEPFGVRLEPER